MLVVTGCGRSDASIQQAMTGTWAVEFGGKIRCTNVISSNGGFTGTVTGFPDGHVIQVAGTIIARGGDLIETITNSSEKNEPLPLIVNGHIIRLDDHEMVTRWDAKQVTTTIAKKLK